MMCPWLQMSNTSRKVSARERRSNRVRETHLSLMTARRGRESQQRTLSEKLATLLTVRQELSEDVVAPEHIHLVSKQEFFRFRFENRLSAGDTGIVDLCNGQMRQTSSKADQRAVCSRVQ